MPEMNLMALMATTLLLAASFCGFFRGHRTDPRSSLNEHGRDERRARTAAADWLRHHYPEQSAYTLEQWAAAYDDVGAELPSWLAELGTA